MIEVAIVEDDAAERARIRECVRYYGEIQGINFSITEFVSGLTFIGGYHAGFDIVFMDIDMPGMNGMDTARKLRTMDTSVILIFVTNMAQYAISGYEVEAMDFVLKPINKYSFALKMKRAVARTGKKNDEYIAVKNRSEAYIIRIASIKYIDLVDHHVVYHTVNGDYSEYITLREAYEKINRNHFVYCNRSYLVNLQYVSSVNKDLVTVGGDELIISRPQRKAFLSALSDYMRGKK